MIFMIKKASCVFLVDGLRKFFLVPSFLHQFEDIDSDILLLISHYKPN